MEFIIAGLFALIMGAGAVTVVFRKGETEGICKYGYLEEDNEK
jgi:hypothetical protein